MVAAPPVESVELGEEGEGAFYSHEINLIRIGPENQTFGYYGGGGDNLISLDSSPVNLHVDSENGADTIVPSDQLGSKVTGQKIEPLEAKLSGYL